MRSKTEAYLENSSTIVLKTYFSKYLAEVRGLSKSSVNHYLDALNHISRRLKAKGLIDNDIYEVTAVFCWRERREMCICGRACLRRC